MTILPGKRLGPYEILSAIGAGGMGEVYRASDMRLDRIVALKILPAELAARAELRERFEREARTIGGLNHPHICVLHDVGRHVEPRRDDPLRPHKYFSTAKSICIGRCPRRGNCSRSRRARTYTPELPA